MKRGQEPGTVQGGQYGSDNQQWNYFAPVTQHIFIGSFERLRDVCFDPAPLVRDLDLDRFTGREWLVAEIEHFIRTRPRGYVVIQAEAGVGKSALAAHLVGTRRWLHHFTRLPGGRSPEAARKSLAAQLIARWGLLAEWAPGGVLPATASRPDWFARLLEAAARHRDEETDGSHEPIVLVVDGLDEAEPDHAGGEGLPLGLPDSLPDGVFVVVTSRFGIDRALHAVRRPADWLRIEVEGADNLADMSRYLEAVTAPDSGDGRLVAALRNDGVDVEWFHANAASTCAGVWIYLRYVLDEIRDGVRSPRGIDQLPGDLAGYYAGQIERWRGSPDDEVAQRRWEQVRLPLLGALGAVREPLTVAELARFAGVASAEAARVFIEETARAFLNQRDDDGVARYALRHQSLRDLLRGQLPDDARQDLISVARILASQVGIAHRQITAALTPSGTLSERNWGSATPYAVRHLAVHAAASGLLDALVCDPGFLLTVDPSTLVVSQDSVRAEEAVRAFAAYELSLSDWAELPGKSMALLAINAARVRASALVSACAGRADTEWRVRWAAWNGQGHRILTGHGDVVNAVAIGAIGPTDVIVSGSDDETARIWDATSGEEIAILDGHDAGVCAVAIGRLTTAGTRDIIITGADDGVARIWDAATGQRVAELSGHAKSVTAVAFGNYGDREVIVTGSNDKTARLWHAATGQHIATITGHLEAITAVAIGRLTTGDRRDIIITGSEDATARIWDAEGNPIGPALDAHREPVTGVAFGRSGDCDAIVTCSDDMTAAIWNAATGECMAMLSPRDVVAASAVDIGYGIIVTGSTGFSASVWDAASGSHRATLTGHEDGVNAVAVGRLGDRAVIVTGSSDETVRIWGSTAGRPAGVPVTGHDDWINALAFGRLGDRDIVVSGSADHTTQVWDAVTGQHLETLGGYTPVNAVAAIRAGGRDIVITGCANGRAEVWDPATGSRISAPLEHHGPVNAVVARRLGGREFIVTGSADRTAGIWDAATREQIALLIGHQAEVNAVATGVLGRRDIVVTGSADCTARVWDAATGDPIGGPLRGHRSAITSIATGRMEGQDIIITGSADTTAVIWDTASGQRIATLPHRAPVGYLSAIRIGERDVIVTSDHNGTLACWDTADQHEIVKAFPDQVDHAGAVALGRVGDRYMLACRSGDSTVLTYEYHGRVDGKPARLAD